MNLGYTIFYVPSVSDTVAFYETAFGFSRTFIHEGGDYGELDTGATKLAFTANALARTVVKTPYVAARPDADAPGMEITLTTDDVDAAYARALAAGAHAVSEPHDEPWGQRVAYVRDLNGFIVGLATPMGG